MSEIDDPTGMEVQHYLGLDLGQSNDPSALTVTQEQRPFKTQWGGGREYGEPSYAVVWIERFDLGTRYTKVVDRVTEVKEAPQTGESPPLVMDATGVGAPVVDQFHDRGLSPEQILFTGGDEVRRDGPKFKVPKQDLATTVQSLLQVGRLTIAEELEQAGQLVQEMKQFRVKWSDAGHARFEHATESDTDDVLLSVACALWYAERGEEMGQLWAA